MRPERRLGANRGDVRCEAITGHCCQSFEALNSRNTTPTELACTVTNTTDLLLSNKAQDNSEQTLLPKPRTQQHAESWRRANRGKKSTLKVRRGVGKKQTEKAATKRKVIYKSKNHRSARCAFVIPRTEAMRGFSSPLSSSAQPRKTGSQRAGGTLSPKQRSMCRQAPQSVEGTVTVMHAP